MGNEENKTLYDIYRGILCNNQSFQLGKQAQVEYRFDCPEYTELKEKYHLNEIAGNGTELEHSVRLLKYLAPKLNTVRGTITAFRAMGWRCWNTV